MWVQAIYLIIITILSVYLASKQKPQEADKVSAEDFTIPTNSEDREIPITYGTNKQTGFNVIAAGDFGTFDIKKKVKSGWSSKKVVSAVGYKLGIVAAIGWGGEGSEIELIEFMADDDTLYRSSSSGSFSAYVSDKTIFGPYEDGAGGMEGNFSYYSGADVQTVDTYANQITQGRQSQLRRLSYLVWKGGYIGNTGSLATWQFIIKRIIKPSVLPIAHADVDGGANAAYVIFDLLTNKNYGLGLPVAAIDIANFSSIARTLKNEGWGLNMIINEKGNISEILDDILSKIDGSININKSNGMIYMKLVRQDYNINDLITFDESNVVSVSNYSRSTSVAMTNQMKITYTDKNNNFQKTQVTYKDPALSYQMSRGETAEADYSVLTNADLALRVAARDLLPLSTPLFKCNVVVNSVGEDLEVGDCVILSLKKYKITQVVMRILEIEYGSIEDPEVSISLIQDKFGFAYDIYSKVLPPAPPFIDYTAVPMDLKIVEAPFYFNEPTDIDGKIIGFGQKPNGTQTNFTLTTKSSTDTDFIAANEIVDFCPVATIYTGFNEQATSILTDVGSQLNTINSETDDDILQGDNLCIITEGTKQEYIAFRSIASNVNGWGLLNVRRGLLDSIPQSFTNAAKIYFINYGYQVNKGSFTGTIQARAITRTLKTELINTTIYSLTSTNRKSRPIAPGNLTVNSLAFSSNMTIPAANIVLRYNSRDRIRGIQFYNTATTANVDNVTYRIRFINPVTGLTVKSVDTQALTYTFDDELAINGGVRFPELRLEIDAIDTASLVSTYKYSIILKR